MAARRGLLFAFTVILVVAAVLPLAVFGAWSVVAQRNALVARSTSTLELLADAQLARVEGTYRSAVTSLGLIASRTQMRDDLAAVIAGDVTEFGRLQRIIDDARLASSDVRALWLTDHHGAVVATTAEPSRRAGDELLAAIEQRVVAFHGAPDRGQGDTDGQGAAMAHVVVDVPNELPRWLLLSPLSLDGSPVGFVVVEFDVAPLVAVMAGETASTPAARLLETASGEQVTGEALAGGSETTRAPAWFATCLYERQDDGGARPIFHGVSGAAGCGLSDASNSAGAAIPADRRTAPAVRVVNGEDGFDLDARDLDGQRVVAVMRYAQGPQWGLTVRVSRDEVFAPAMEATHRTLAVAVAVAIAASIGAYLLAGALTRQIVAFRDAAQRLTESTRRRGAAARRRPVATVGIGEADHNVADSAHDVAVGDGGGAATLPLDAPGELGDLAGAFRDMANTVDYQHDELARRIDQLEVVAHAMAHDLKNPLSTTLGVLSTLDSGRVDDPELRKELVRRGLSASERMGRLIGDLLAVMHADRVAATVEDVDLDVLVAEVVRDQAAEPYVHVPRPLGKVRGDAVLLRQALDNVVANAVSYHAQGVTPRVEVTVEHSHDGVDVHIDDAGVGIPSDERQAVLGLFARGSNVATSPGTGVGLAIVERVMAQHGGAVRIDDSTLGGTRITLSLRA